MKYYELLTGYAAWFLLGAADHLLQSTVFLLISLIAVILLKNGDARSRYILWLAALIKFAVPIPVLIVCGSWLEINKSFFIKLQSEILPANVFEIALNSSPMVAVANEKLLAGDHPYNLSIYLLPLIIWITGIILWIIIWLKHWQNFRIIFKERNPPTLRETQLLSIVLEQLQIKFDVNLFVSSLISEPAALGIFNPSIVLPAGLSENLSDEELKSILVHELTHVKRRDNLIGILTNLITCLLWFYPPIRLISKNLLKERERICDETVLKYQFDPTQYISGLLKVVKFGLQTRPFPGVASATGADIKKRLEVIMNSEKNKYSKWTQLVAGTTVLCLTMVCFLAVFASIQYNDQSPQVNHNTSFPPVFDVKMDENQQFQLIAEQDEDTPFKILSAKVKVISPDKYKALTASKTDLNEVISVPEIICQNVSDKTIVTFATIINDKEAKTVQGLYIRDQSIKPGSKFTIYPENFVKSEGNPETNVKYWLPAKDKSKVAVRMVVYYDDGTIWVNKNYGKGN